MVETLIANRLDDGRFIFQVSLKRALLVPVSLRFVYTDVKTGSMKPVESETYFNTSMINFSLGLPPFERFRIGVALKAGNITGPCFISEIEYGECSRVYCSAIRK